MIYNTHATPEDLREVDPRPRLWDDEKAGRVVTVRLEIRFGAGSDVAQMLGLAPVPQAPKPVCAVCGRHPSHRRGLCRFCIGVETRGEKHRAVAS